MIPKYRAWYLKMKMMCEVVDIDFLNEQVSCKVASIHNDIMTWDFYMTVLMQSTHIKDKNKKELFDGDIVMMKWTVYDEPTPYVIWQSRTGEWRVDNRVSGRVLGFSNEDCELVGNVFENFEEYPELKKEWLDRQEQRRKYLE